MKVQVSFELPAPHALALAQFVKRIGWQEVRVNAVNDDETYQIFYALDQLRSTLAEAGFAPR